MNIEKIAKNADAAALKELATEYDRLYCWLLCMFETGDNINERIEKVARSQAKNAGLAFDELTAEQKLDLLVNVLNLKGVE